MPIAHIELPGSRPTNRSRRQHTPYWTKREPRRAARIETGRAAADGAGRAWRLLRASCAARVDRNPSIVDTATMRYRHSAIFLSALALWGLPTLCVAGVLIHPCADDDGHCSDCEPSDCGHEVPDDNHDGGCGHESDCSSDPCARTFVRPGRLAVSGPTLEPRPVAFYRDADEISASAAAPHPHSAIKYDARLPIHPSDHPLLI